uniref:Uncharacterized protein n=1 Tax=Avena sativa TaxID=4498 RepID=A0ACD5YVX9_AVESA
MVALVLGRYLLLMGLLLAGTCGAAPPLQHVSSSEATRVHGITAIYNFGDSISDTGNLLREGDTGLLNYTAELPYGVTIGRPTGRCSDGYLMIDFLAKDLGLPLLNPYLDRRADFTHGVNFAVGGATALTTAALGRRGITVPHTNSSLEVQLAWFKEFMRSTTNNRPREIRKKLACSLVMMGEIGGNDYNYAFLQPRPTNGRYDAVSNATRMAESMALALALVPQVVRSITHAAKEVLDMGARKMVIPGNFPIGCMPSYLSSASPTTTSSSSYDGYGCLVSFNLVARAHNACLRRAVGKLRRSYPRAMVAYADYYAAYLDILGNAPRFGFQGGKASRTACCGAGGAYNFVSGRLCGAPGTAVCADPGGRVSWDGIHMTQHAYGVMAELLYRGGLACPVPVKLPRHKDCAHRQ